jgi:hypothetical protein
VVQQLTRAGARAVHPERVGSALAVSRPVPGERSQAGDEAVRAMLRLRVTPRLRV